MPSTMEQPSFLPPEEKPKRPEFVEPKMPQSAEVVDTSNFIELNREVEMVQCKHCDASYEKVYSRCPGCGA